MRKYTPLILFSLNVLMFGLFLSCAPEAKKAPEETQNTASQAQNVSFEAAFSVITASCMPCHNVATLPTVIEKTRKASFSELDGEERVRIVNDLENLLAALKAGEPLNLVGEKEIQANFAAMPGELYTMLEKGVMSPAWAPALMKEIQWPQYQPLTPEKRVLLMQYAKPFSEKYLR